MKVLFLDSVQLYEDLLPAGLRQVGCTVKTLHEVLDGALESALVEFQPDFALTMGWSWFPTQDRLAVIRQVLEQHQVPLVYWATEDPVWHEQWTLPYIKNSRPSLVATICEEYLPRYAELGIPALTLPFGYNPDLYRTRTPRPEFECDIALVANFYTTDFHNVNRKRSIQDLLTPLLEQGHNIKIWGNSWQLASQYGIELPEGAWQGYLDHRETPSVYNTAKIVLGLQNEFDFATNLTMRTCEVLGSGGFLLTSRTKAIEGIFADRTHLVTSGSPAETLELVVHYLAHPEERRQIAQNGQAFVRANHTYAQRAVDLLVEVMRLRGVAATTDVVEFEAAGESGKDCSAVPPLPPGPYMICCCCCCKKHKHHRCECKCECDSKCKCKCRCEECSGSDHRGRSGHCSSGSSDHSGSEQSGPSGSEQSGLSGSEYSGRTGSAYSGLSGSEQSGLSGSAYSGLSGSECSGLSGSEYSGLSGSEYSGLSGSEYSGLTGSECSDSSDEDWSMRSLSDDESDEGWE